MVEGPQALSDEMIAVILRMVLVETPMREQIARCLEAGFDSLWFRHFDTPSVALNWEGFMVKHNRLLHKERDQQVFVVEQIGLDKL
ncbi:hypothetical protein NL30_11500 [Burkholderia contaminans]|nr:hypothetical protein NL30_11500 [Burkholderia contaminans]TCW73128.1 hypothetical protein C5O79_04235 [Burkholderia sp. SRS-25]